MCIALLGAPPAGAEHYNDPIYQRVVELERGCENGLAQDEVYRAEATLALHQFPELAPGEGVLDLASGTGRHALLMSDHFRGRVPIRALEASPALVGLATQAVEAREQRGVRENVRFLLRDMKDVAPGAVEDGVRYKVITCLGSSFCYHNNKDMRAMLSNFLQVLEPGGRLVIQFRESEPQPTADMFEAVEQGRSRLGMRVERRTVGGREVEVYEDRTRGDAVYDYPVDCPHPDPDNPRDYAPGSRSGCRTYRDRDGFEYRSFARRYTDPAGDVTDLPPAVVNSFVKSKSFPDAKRVLEEVGFHQVELVEGEHLGAHRNLAIVAVKPTAHQGSGGA